MFEMSKYRDLKNEVTSITHFPLIGILAKKLPKMKNSSQCYQSFTDLNFPTSCH